MDATDSLLRRCQGGDHAALAELVRLYQVRLYHFGMRIVADPALAEEAAAETFVKVWSRCMQWRGEGGNTWIYRIAVRVILDLRRGRKRWWHRWGGRLEHANPATLHDPPELLGEAEEQNRNAAAIHEALCELDDTDRALVHLFYFENRGLAEIAEILETGRDALKMRLMRIRERLRKRLRGLDERA